MRVLISLILGLVYAGLVWAIEPPTVFVQQVADGIIGDLRINQKFLKREPKRIKQIIRQKLLPHIYVHGMANAVLGRRTWQSIDTQQREQFKRLLVNMVIQSYARVLRNYEDETITVHPLRDGYNNQNRIEVRSVLNRSHAPSIPLNYRLVQRNGHWYIYDILIEGISMLQNFRSQIHEELTHGPFPKLLQTMEAHYGS